jgi:5-(carboxyamino)imidazole ribonucleotide synthase
VRIGIIGGGQLGMMLAEAAEKLSHQVFVLEPKENPSVANTRAIIIPYAYDDPQGLELLHHNTDVIIYEFENINVEHIKKYEHKIPQGINALKISQDRLIEKDFASSLGIPTASYIPFNSKADCINGFYPSVLKTTRLGYDGKGQKLIHNLDELSACNIDQPMILEAYIDFDDEVSVVLTRDHHGQIAYLPLIKNEHKDGILHTSKPLWQGYDEVREKAFKYGKMIAEALNYVGTLAIEFFVKGDDVIFNEMAPRPHNSGHFSIEGATVSQFENMILAVTNQSVIEPEMTCFSMMFNILGQHHGLLTYGQKLNYIFVHDYHKNSVKHNRKIGHMTCCADTIDLLNDTEAMMRGAYHD